MCIMRRNEIEQTWIMFVCLPVHLIITDIVELNSTLFDIARVRFFLLSINYFFFFFFFISRLLQSNQFSTKNLQTVHKSQDGRSVSIGCSWCVTHRHICTYWVSFILPQDVNIWHYILQAHRWMSFNETWLNDYLWLTRGIEVGLEASLVFKALQSGISNTLLWQRKNKKTWRIFQINFIWVVKGLRLQNLRFYRQ